MKTPTEHSMTRPSLRLCTRNTARAVIVTDNSRELPGTCFVLPEVNELRFTTPFATLSHLRITKPMDTYLHRAISTEGIYLKRFRNQIPMHFAADIVLESFDRALPSPGQTSLIVIKLQIVS